MKKAINLLVLSTTFLLLGCRENVTSISEEAKNPLTASRYEQELADTLANFIIQKEKFTEDPNVFATIQKHIGNAKDRLTDAERAMAEGMMGNFIPMKTSVLGHAMLIGNTLYFSSDFETKPGIDLHVYLTETVDPRDGVFPDATAVDLGNIQAAYGAQTYNVPGKRKEGALRTVVLWDKGLEVLYSFGQLSK